jgi:hypothetical protein
MVDDNSYENILGAKIVFEITPALRIGEIAYVFRSSFFFFFPLLFICDDDCVTLNSIHYLELPPATCMPVAS